MKIVYKDSIAEGFIKTVDKMKNSLDKKYDADEIRKDTKNIIIDSNRKLIDKLMIYWFVCSDWWANGNLSGTCNLRPGTEKIDDFNTFLGDILRKSEAEQIEYLHKNIDFSVYFDSNNTIIIEVPLTPSAFPINTIEFSGNTIFSYLNKAEKSFNEYLKYPVKLKVKLMHCQTQFAFRNKCITYIKFNQSVLIKNIVNFFTERVSNPETLELYPYLELRVMNRVEDSDLSELFKLGDKVKFHSVLLKTTETFLNRRFGISTGSICPPGVMAKLETLDGIENLLHDNTCIITLSRVFKNNPKLAENIEGKENIE